MEEWRAERVALTLMLWLYENKRISLKKLQESLFSFALYDLRRFANFNSKTLRPYIISAIDTYNIYEKVGYLKFVNNKLIVNKNQTLEVLKLFKKDLEFMLKAIVDNNSSIVTKLLNKAEKQGNLVNLLVNTLSK